MAERLRSTGRKSNSLPPSSGGAGGAPLPGTETATIVQAMAALIPAAMKAQCQPAKWAMRSPVAKESAPDTPMLAACAATARDIIRSSTRSASSLRPVM
jgi:hypothetical protein